MRIYVASLSDYNAGRLHGAWIDFEPEDTPDGIWAEIEAMLQASPEISICQWCGNDEAGQHIGHSYMGGIVEEWEIHDYEGWPDGMVPSKHSIEELVTISNAVDEHGDAYLAWMDNTGDIDPDNMPEYSTYEDAEELGKMWYDGMYGMEGLDAIEYYVNWKAFGESLMVDGQYTEYGNTIYEWYG